MCLDLKLTRILLTSLLHLVLVKPHFNAQRPLPPPTTKRASYAPDACCGDNGMDAFARLFITHPKTAFKIFSSCRPSTFSAKIFPLPWLSPGGRQSRYRTIFQPKVYFLKANLKVKNPKVGSFLTTN